METLERRGMTHGVYVLRWKTGGESLASVGSDEWGRNWFAPSNWLYWPGMTGMPAFDWMPVESCELIAAHGASYLDRNASR